MWWSHLAAYILGISEIFSEMHTTSAHANMYQKRPLLIWISLTTCVSFIWECYAQIPNPLFDLAGITCGHFLVPFWTFFGATMVGKAVIKMHIQVHDFVLLLVCCLLHDKPIFWVGLFALSPDDAPIRNSGGRKSRGQPLDSGLPRKEPWNGSTLDR